MLPQVSVPIDIGAKPALTPTAEPVDEPPGFWTSVSSASRTGGRSTDAVAGSLVVRVNPTRDVSGLALAPYCRPATAKGESSANGSCKHGHGRGHGRSGCPDRSTYLTQASSYLGSMISTLDKWKVMF